MIFKRVKLYLVTSFWLGVLGKIKLCLEREKTEINLIGKVSESQLYNLRIGEAAEVAGGMF